MPYLNHLPIMPKESKAPMANRIIAPYPTASSSDKKQPSTWTTAEDETLVRARAAGLNWEPIQRKYFPHKSPNACRKRHERIIQNRQVDDWASNKLELLSTEYANCRKEMWQILAARLGVSERQWTILEEKCMEKGLKTLLSTARKAQRGGHVEQQSFEDEVGGNSDRASDSGIGLGSDTTEMEVGANQAGPSSSTHWHAHMPQHTQQLHVDHHARSRSLPQIPLYQPPPPVTQSSLRSYEGQQQQSGASTQAMGYVMPQQATYSRYSPDSQNGRGGISIQSVIH